MSKTGKSEDKARAKTHPPTLIGWAVRIGSFAVLGLITAVLALEIARPSHPTEIRVEPQWNEIRVTSTGQVLVPARVTNQGSDPLRNLTLEFVREGSDPVKVDIPLLGEKEQRTEVVGYDRRPARIDYKILSYETD